ncbi:MAG: hypothetical protein IPI78_16390 [Chitinophagaceae bacterium]|nr:hypothetical protein [Chitinophagaceae bacterium]
MKKNIISTIIICLLAFIANSQIRFLPTIKVDFEKTTSVRQLMKDMEEGNSWFEQNKDRYPVSLINYYEFTGDTSHSIYKPGKKFL